jgi:hypothetical protein
VVDGVDRLVGIFVAGIDGAGDVVIKLRRASSDATFVGIAEFEPVAPGIVVAFHGGSGGAGGQRADVIVSAGVAVVARRCIGSILATGCRQAGVVGANISIVTREHFPGDTGGI